MKKLALKIFFASVLLSTNFITAQTLNDSLFLKPAKFINSDNPKITAKAAGLIKGCKTEEEKVKNIFEFVRDSYSKKDFDSFIASEILDSGGNSCRQRSILMAALCRAAGVPSRLHWQKVKITGYKYDDQKTGNMIFIHGITGVKINGKWCLYETVGNPAKWKVWVQSDEEYKVEFKPDQDCLFHNTDRIQITTLPLYFSDHYDIFPFLWEKFADDEIGIITESTKD